ncbi:MAG: TatD family hydrolase, partial [Candidatus Gracilibacteria bacterium]
MIDTHAHIMFPEFAADLEAVLERAAAAGVEKIVAVACDLKSCDGARELAEKYPQVYATLGLHPYEAESVNEELLKKWEEEILKNKKIVAIGECGLDYFKAKVEKSVQKKAFEMQLEFAVKMNLPVIIHNRDADEDCLEILKKFEKVHAVFHCFEGDVSFAQSLWAAGYLTSFTGIVTYPKAEKLREVLSMVPLD